MSDDTKGPDGFDPTPPSSLLPYDTWLEEAHREVMLKALEHISVHGLPGEHHFYMTFLTRFPGVVIPAALKERYPEEMTIVLQHQFQNLTVDRSARSFSVGLSFGGVPSTLHIPFAAITAFADPHIHLVLRFTPHYEEEAPPAEVHNFRPTPHEQKPDHAAKDDTPTPAAEGAEVVSLAAFRKKPAAQHSDDTDDSDR
ncbi:MULTISPECIES: SspB family protein [Bombella]|uniref:ClpXP protease specificity-enhancing factor SspB n=1 Tax=Bombella pollinis TaxID=2967337 RepID=A0ABT3WQ44_9PROT|nr:MULTISPECIES: ClpXP protease specificity-enhancing factor SspB [Bombella]MCT6839018.1 ClpXP protease specificity-enhancing factor SspB [Bifidobacteriales bacterium]MCT6856295.1 ClpXP protease specificity-enhancing factor SspB [Bombella apis]MCX5620344.1 ClpXP protease specificity-enhancing factor SspB [Bombella pollinis]MUG05326.1 hypothetical protein [Bombella sp. ESL0378]MUG90873.1 hypothetical protein [Bombella sp. ESL0385]